MHLNQRDGKESTLNPKGPLKKRKKIGREREIMARGCRVELQMGGRNGIEFMRREIRAEEWPQSGEWAEGKKKEEGGKNVSKWEKTG